MQDSHCILCVFSRFNRSMRYLLISDPYFNLNTFVHILQITVDLNEVFT